MVSIVKLSKRPVKKKTGIQAAWPSQVGGKQSYSKQKANKDKKELEYKLHDVARLGVSRVRLSKKQMKEK